MIGVCWMKLKGDRMASLDYLRLASFDFNYSSLLADILKWYPGGWHPGRWLQYKGWRKESFFVGVGEQDGKRHMVVSASGIESNRLADFMDGYLAFYCTRIDVQRTIKRPKHANLRRIRYATKTENCTLIQSKENDTLYIGSRSSACFTRLYEKPLDEMYLRLEFELKGARARAAWGAMVHGKTPANVYSHYLKKSKIPETVKVWFAKESDDDTFKADNEASLHSARKKLKWLRSLDSSIEKAMSNHEIGEEVREIVRAWAKYANYLDKS